MCIRDSLHAVGCGGFVETLNRFCQFFFLSCQAIDIISKAEIGDCSVFNAYSAFMIFYGVYRDPFQKYVEEGG